ncbi:MAG: tetratricopeptide repeat protein [Candidatus Omnitrophota bacterium]
MSYAVMLQRQEAGKQRFKEGHYSESERCFQTAIKEAEKFQAPNEYLARQIKNLGVFYFALGELENAEHLFKQSLAMERELHGLTSLEVCKSLNHLGLLYQIHEKYPQAEETYEQALKIVEQASFQRYPEVDSKLHYLSLHLLAMVYCAQNKQDAAIEMCNKAAGKITRNAGWGGKEISMDIHDVAVNYCNRDRLPEAKKACEWLLQSFSEQLQTEFLGAVSKDHHRKRREMEFETNRMKSVLELASAYEDVWRPSVICRDEAVPSNRLAPSAPPKAAAPDNRLSNYAEESWRP